MRKDICIKKSALVEKLGIHIESNNGYAPLASRILAYIILTGKGGTTFEDLVLKLCASKSTISTHLNHLQDLKTITYFTKPGDRKKYFVVKRDRIIQNIDELIASWLEEKNLHKEVKLYKQTINDLESTEEDLKFDLSFHNNYIQFLEEATLSIKELRSKIHNNQF